jgi:hypothetical protein
VIYFAALKLKVDFSNIVAGTKYKRYILCKQNVGKRRYNFGTI